MALLAPVVGDQPYLIELQHYDSNPVLKKNIEHSLAIIEEAFVKYSEEGVVLAFNGGKDSVVLLYLIYAVLAHRHKARGEPAANRPRLSTIYFLCPNSFPEVTEFMNTIGRAYASYNLDVHTTDKSFKAGLTELVYGPGSHVKAIFMGTRRSDPAGSSLDPFSVTDAGWPQVMRVNPILDWSYTDIWHFIHTQHISYCCLYDHGYTSIGQMDDTRPNDNLFDPATSSYKPACQLKDGSLERAGRGKVALSCPVPVQ